MRTPNFNHESKLLDKHWLVRMPPTPLTPDLVATIDKYYRRRWQTLLAVDEMVESMIIELKRMNLYDNTYIIFTSDNGYHLGQFAMPYDKRQPYETDIRIPFIVTGPGIRSKHIVEHPITLVDLMPTIFDWAGIEKPKEGLDGQSFASIAFTHSNTVEDIEVTSENSEYETSSLVMQSEKFEREFLIEYWGEGTTETFNSQCPWHRSDRLNVSGQRKIFLKSKNQIAKMVNFNFEIFDIFQHFSSVPQWPAAIAWIHGTTPMDVSGILHTIWIKSIANSTIKRYTEVKMDEGETVTANQL